MRGSSALVAIALLTRTVPARADLKPVDQRGEQAERQFDRRLIDVAVRGGGALAECEGNCEGLSRFGPAAGLALTLRANEELSAGAFVERAWFKWRAKDGSTSTADVTYSGFVARLHVSSQGRLDPWVEVAWLPLFSGLPVAPRLFGLGAAGGLDFFVTKLLKAGPYGRLEMTLIEPTTSEADTHSGAQPSDGPVAGLFQLGLAVTFTFGPVVH